MEQKNTNLEIIEKELAMQACVLKLEKLLQYIEIEYNDAKENY